MEGEKFRITLTDDAKLFCIHKPQVVPFALRDKLRAKLELLPSQGVIAPVTEPTEWCATIFVTPRKGTDKIRMCIDLSQLNEYVKRERVINPCTTPVQAIVNIAAESVKTFTKLEALTG